MKSLHTIFAREVALPRFDLQVLAAIHKEIAKYVEVRKARQSKQPTKSRRYKTTHKTLQIQRGAFRQEEHSLYMPLDPTQSFE